MKERLYVYFLLLIVAMCVWHCRSSKPIYVCPPHLVKYNQDSLLALFNRGQLLYKQNCSDCHGIFSKGKDGVPNFSSAQIIDYFDETVISGQTKHAILKNMPFEDMETIRNFLVYRAEK